MRTAPTTGDDSARPELMLSAGDPVNVGDSSHLVVELADVAAHDVEISALFHHSVVNVVVLLEEPLRRDDGGPAIACSFLRLVAALCWCSGYLALVRAVCRRVGLPFS